MFGFISTLLKFYFLLFVILSHTSIMSCRFGELKVETREYDWRKVNQQLLGKCHQVIISNDLIMQLPGSIFQVHEFFLKNYPDFSGFLVKHTNDVVLSRFPDLQDVLLLSGLLLSVAETVLV